MEMNLQGRMCNLKIQLLSASFICVALLLYSLFLNFPPLTWNYDWSRRCSSTEADGQGRTVDESSHKRVSDKQSTSWRFDALHSEANENVLRNLGPSLRMEKARRHVLRTSRDLGNFIRYQLSQLIHINSMGSTVVAVQHDKRVSYIMDNLPEYERVIEDQLEVMSNSDGWQKWRKQEIHLLQEIVQNRLHALQNPKSCSGAPILLCNLTNPHGFASGVHDVLWCFIKAYYTQRRMVLVTSEWHYAPDGWQTFFKPLSDVCPHSEKSDVKNIAFGPGDNDAKSRYLITVLPEDLGPRIARIHGNPLVWWYGQFIKYLFRPNSQLEILLEDIRSKNNFGNSVVGIHVRRSDKIGSEAKSHELIEYMRRAEDYFRSQEVISPSVVRKVYIATDAPEIIKECQKKFQHYSCSFNPGSAKLASDLETRYVNASRWGVLLDVFMLAHTNLLVCTLSSGLCRLAYELMQAVHEDDASNRVVSLDVQYHYAWVNPPRRRAIYNHLANSPRELSFTKGDECSKKDEYSVVYEALKGKVANGFDKLSCSNLRARIGLVPTYKTEEIYGFCDFQCLQRGGGPSRNSEDDK